MQTVINLIGTHDIYKICGLVSLNYGMEFYICEKHP
jgi:hypothetical protein